ncbi:YcdB/YcdC domain-containing protein [Brevibacillus ginsengisoli]|uniref:YcdB/YcdC domain-containing protein n=1 Tax=Brevibacillus ginsengisoli TaxID=363854 RepID=UPI003CF3F769
MKRIITRSCLLVLSTSLLFPFTPALANAYTSSAGKPMAIAAAAQSNAKFSKEQAIAQAKKYFSISDDYTIENTSFRAADVWRPFPEWSFNWVKKSVNPEAGQPSIYIAIQADTGELTSYSSYSPEKSKPVSKAISRDAAEKIAQSFVSKMAPERAKEVQLYTKDTPTPKTPLGTNVIHYFRYVRMVNDVPFLDNGIDISIDGNGRIINYQYNWNDKIKFEKQKPISPNAAIEAFKKNANAQLSFVLPWEKGRSGENNQPLLVYPNPFTSFYVDALTGKPLTMGLNEFKPNEISVPVSDKSLAPLHSGNSLDQDAASAFASKLFGLSDYNVQSANYSENDYRGNRPVWDINFERKDKAPTKRFVNVSLDAKTGDVLNYNTDSGYPTPTKEKPAFTQEQGRDKAIQFIRQYSPTLASSLFAVPNIDDYKTQMEQGRMSFNFKRMVQGIAAASGDAYVTLDTKTGEIVSYYLSTGNETYPTKVPNHHSGSDAISAYLKESETNLLYVLPPVLEQSIPTGTIPERTATLVYRMTSTPSEQPYLYDAVVGDWKNQSNGKSIILHRPVPSDLKNHPAATELGLLYEYDAISLIDGKIMPDRPITRGEMIDMLVIALNQGRDNPYWLSSRKASFDDVGNGSRYFASIETAVNMGILDKSNGSLKPDEKITREELADLLVRSLGYKKLASHTSLFTTTLTDVADSKVRGSIAIIDELGIMSGTKGKFKPKASVSRADAAVSFYRFLDKRREMNEAKDPNYRY